MENGIHIFSNFNMSEGKKKLDTLRDISYQKMLTYSFVQKS